MLFVLAAWALVAVVTVAVLLPLIDRAIGAALGSAETSPIHGTRLSQATSGFLAGRSGPTTIAVLFALLSLPIVALSLDAVDTTGDAYFFQNDWSPATSLGQWSAAASAVLFSAVIAGTVGAPLVRRHARIGALVTFHLALLVAIPALPILPALLGQNVGAGVLCIDMCQATTNTNNLLNGLFADLFFVFSPLPEPVPIVTLIVGVGLWTVIVRRLERGSARTDP
jgi:hypothetical protein